MLIFRLPVDFPKIYRAREDSIHYLAITCAGRHLFNFSNVELKETIYSAKKFAFSNEKGAIHNTDI